MFTKLCMKPEAYLLDVAGDRGLDPEPDLSGDLDLDGVARSGVRGREGSRSGEQSPDSREGCSGVRGRDDSLSGEHNPDSRDWERLDSGDRTPEGDSRLVERLVAADETI